MSARDWDYLVNQIIDFMKNRRNRVFVNESRRKHKKLKNTPNYIYSAWFSLV